MTRAEENYLKTIFHLFESGESAVSTKAIAEELRTQPSSVTDMLQKLADKELVHYVKYKGATLTDKGNKTALNIIRKHRLWEAFLVEELDFAWDEIHEVAEQLEHIKSEKLIDQIEKLLGYPDYDPHGDPIPKKDGSYPKRNQVLLSDMPVGTEGICSGVKDTSTKFLQYLDKHKIALGDALKIVEKEAFDQSLLLDVGTREIRISHQIAKNIYLKTN